MKKCFLLAVVTSACTPSGSVHANAAAGASAGRSPFDDLCVGSRSIPLEIEGSREFVEVGLPNSKVDRRLRFHVDTGGNTAGLMIRASALRELGVAPSELPSSILLGSHAVPLPTGAHWLVLNDDDETIRFERLSRKDLSVGQIGAGFLSGFLVCIDPGHARMGLAEPNSIPPVREPGIPLLLQTAGSGQAMYPFVHLLILEAGKPVAGYGVLLDTGATTSMLDRNKVEYIHAHHPGWPVAIGSFGDADMIGGQWGELLLRVPDVAIDAPRAGLKALGLDQYVSKDLGPATFVDRPTGTWDRMFGSVPLTMGSHGALANDVLLRYRLIIDYLHARLHVEPTFPPAMTSAASERVGIAVRFGQDGCPAITQVTDTNSELTRASMRAGDVLVAVDGRDACAMQHHELAEALAGPAGSEKRLRLRRSGQVLDVSVTTARLL
jgi:hypothetical protein